MKANQETLARSRRERKREYLEPEEINQLLEASRKSGHSRYPGRDYAIFLTMFLHGLRVSELCKLKLSDIDLKRRILFVLRLKNGKPAEHPIKAFLQRPFSAHSEVKAIQDWLATRETMEPKTDNLFITERGGALSRQNVSVLIARTAKEAGLTKLAVHPHMLRHSIGYHLVNKGTNIRVVQDYMGHRRIESTVIYTAINPARFNELL